MKIQNYRQALSYFTSFIPKQKLPFSGQFGLDRARFLLNILGNPQNKIPIIHVAGTSGKGSTSFYISRILHAHGLKTGLHVSPHLLDVRERFQINNALISHEELILFVNHVVPAVEKTVLSFYGKPTYFEVLIALAYVVFLEKEVDVAVIETGMGGLYDGTNTVSSDTKLSVLTRIGLDHTQILGKSLGAIARQKAGIILPKSYALSSPQSKIATQVISKIAKQQKARLLWTTKSTIDSREDPSKQVFSYRYGKTVIKNITLPTPAQYQVENATLAITACMLFAKTNKHHLSSARIKEVLAKSGFAGRMDVFKKGNKTIIIDGAHNPQKIAALIKSLIRLAPHKKFAFIVAFKEGKDAHSMIKQMLPLAEKIIFTSFFLTNQDMQNISENPTTLLKYAKVKGLVSDIEPDPQKAFLHTVTESDFVVITGSLYLVGELYSIVSRWAQMS